MERSIKLAGALPAGTRSADAQFAAGRMHMMVGRSVITRAVVEAMRPFDRLDAVRILLPQIGAGAESGMERLHADKQAGHPKGRARQQAGRRSDEGRHLRRGAGRLQQGPHQIGRTAGRLGAHRDRPVPALARARLYPAQQDSLATSLAKPCAANFRPSTVVR
jgi:hypothetical protein